MLNSFKIKYQLNNIETIIFILFSLLPVTYILGNFFLNLNVSLAGILFLINSKIKKEEIIKKNLSLDKFLFLFLSIMVINISIKNTHYLFDTISLVRFIFFFLAFNYLIKKLKQNLNHLFLIWISICSIIGIDICYEVMMGHNLIGITSPNAERVASFFGNELIVGSFILGFSYFIIPVLIEKKMKIVFLITLIIIPFLIFLTGERSNFIKSIIISFLILFYFRNIFSIKIKLFSFLILICLIITSLTFSEKVLNRQKVIFDQIYNSYQSGEFKKNSKHLLHYDAAINVIKNNIWTGVGNKNYRHACLEQNQNEKITERFSVHYICSTHPHNFYLEQISEQGIIIFLLIFLFLIFFLVKSQSRFLDCYKAPIFSTLYIMAILIPFLPNGRFFGTPNATLFFLHLSYCYFYYKSFFIKKKL